MSLGNNVVQSRQLPRLERLDRGTDDAATAFLSLTTFYQKFAHYFVKWTLLNDLDLAAYRNYDLSS